MKFGGAVSRAEVVWAVYVIEAIQRFSESSCCSTTSMLPRRIVLVKLLKTRISGCKVTYFTIVIYSQS
jgi:hypothetical protein